MNEKHDGRSYFLIIYKVCNAMRRHVWHIVLRIPSSQNKCSATSLWVYLHPSIYKKDLSRRTMLGSSRDKSFRSPTLCGRISNYGICQNSLLSGRSLRTVSAARHISFSRIALSSALSFSR